MILEPRAETSGSPIDLTPVIDMVFLLLIFFLAATSFQRFERETKIALPITQAAGPISAALAEIVINVAADGEAIVGGKAVDDSTLGAILREAVRSNPEQKVTLRGDRNAAYAHVARVLDLCKRHGVQQPFLESIPAR